MLKILYFASLRETLGQPLSTLEHKPDESVAKLVQRLIALDNSYNILLDPSIKVAVNQMMAGLDTVLRDGDELAFFPPVTGG